jgi:hypothetical protein
MTGGNKPLGEKLEDLHQAFIQGEQPGETKEAVAAALLELVLDRERVRHQVAPGTQAAAKVDRLTLSRMRSWDTDDPALAVIEKFLRRLAEERGVDALQLLEKAIKTRKQSVSEEQRRKASTPRKPRPFDQLIESLVAAKPKISAKELERALKAQVGKGVIAQMDDSDIDLVGSSKPIKTASLPDRLTKARKKIFKAGKLDSGGVVKAG